MAKNNNNGLESGTVREKIILFLRDGKPKHFTDITKGLNKHDFTINRELKILIDSNWILKTGKKPKTLYSLDLTRPDVQEYLKRADVAIPSDSEIKEVKFDFCYEKSSHWRKARVVYNKELSEILSCLPEEQKKFVMELIDKPYDFEKGHRALMKEVTSDLFNKIQIHAILDKNTVYMPQMNDLDYEDLVFLINRLLEDQVAKIYEIEIKKDRKTAYKNHDKIRQQVYDKPFKLIISYNPKKD
jgi:hypothetical protein